MRLTNPPQVFLKQNLHPKTTMVSHCNRQKSSDKCHSHARQHLAHRESGLHKRSMVIESLWLSKFVPKLKHVTVASKSSEVLGSSWGLVLGTSSNTEKEKLRVPVYPFLKAAILHRSQDPGFQMQSPVTQFQKGKKKTQLPSLYPLI